VSPKNGLRYGRTLAARVALILAVLAAGGCGGGTSSNQQQSSAASAQSATSSPAIGTSPSTASVISSGTSYTLKASIPLYAVCVNLAQDLVTEDPKPRVVALLRPGTKITAIEPGWTQVNYEGDTYLYMRDTQDIRVHSKMGDGCLSFGDSMADDGTVRDAGLQQYLNAPMSKVDRDPQFTVGGNPQSESIEHLDGKTHYQSTAELNSAEGTDL